MYSQAIVIDNGSGTCRAGIAGEKGPTTCFPPIVGKQVRRHQEDVYIGDEAQAKRKELQLSFPIERGHINGSSWGDMEKIWHHCFSNELKVKPEEHPVLLTEARMNLATRERMIQIMFETFNVPSFCLATPAALSLIACGRSTGIVLDSGYGVTYTVPIFEGKSLPDAIMSIDWAGKDLTEYLMQLLNDAGYFFSNSEREIANEIKEKFCYVAKDFDSELKSGKEIEYTLPDGQGITIESQAFRCPEVLFQPAKYGQEYLGIHELTFQSIKKCGEEIREHLYGNVVLSGGSTMFEGMAERLGKEVTALAPSNTKVNVVVPEEKRFSSWVGGSIVSSLSSFQDKWITKADFDESGPGVVHEKAL